MKCTNCDGTGKEKLYDKLTHAYLFIKCAYCNGTGEIQQIEQEYIQTCTTEQLAEVFGSMLLAHGKKTTKDGRNGLIMKWLAR